MGGVDEATCVPTFVASEHLSVSAALDSHVYARAHLRVHVRACACVEGLAARKNYGRAVYATGWDSKSAILRVRDVGSADAPTEDRCVRVCVCVCVCMCLWQGVAEAATSEGLARLRPRLADGVAADS